MKTFLFFFLAGVLFILGFKVFAQETQSPIYKERECWLFRSVSKNYQGYVSGVRTLPADGNHKICFLGGKFLEVDGDTKSEISAASTWNSILYMAENHYLKFPLIVGRKTTEDYQTRIRGTNQLSKRTSETSILGVEDITSSAGVYQTFKIQKEDWCGRGRLCGRWIYFYSPQTKSVVKYNYEATLGSTASREVELINFWPVQ